MTEEIKEGSQTDISNKKDVTSNETNNTFNAKESDDVHQVNHQKIKINEQKLKDAKEKTMEIKSDTNKEHELNITDEINQKNNNLYIHEKKYYFQIKRCLRGKRKKIILIILLICSLFLLGISLVDLINTFRNIFNFDKILNNNIFIFIAQILYICSLLIFLILLIISERKDNFIINLLFLITICLIFSCKIFLFIKKINTKYSNILHCLMNFCLTGINLVILLITLRIIKMKKSEQQNIEEIINFTDLPQGASANKIDDKKDNQLVFNSSGTDNKPESDNKIGMTGLVEEINNKENEADNADNNEQK